VKLYDEALRNLDVVRAMGVGWVLTTRRLSAPFVPVARVDRVVAYRVGGALPLAYVRTRGGGVAPVRSLALDASHVYVRVETVDGGTLVLTQNDAPGWELSIDGKPARGRREFGTFRAAIVQSGAHEIVWRYRPGSMIIGGITTLATILMLLLSAGRLWGSRPGLSSAALTKKRATLT
jgi:hypothetical protein